MGPRLNRCKRSFDLNSREQLRNSMFMIKSERVIEANEPSGKNPISSPVRRNRFDLIR
jgi:hypothetical protein